MAKKVRCPGCGAKNAADLHRCRVCTAIINAEAPEAPPKGLRTDRRGERRIEAAIEAAAEANQREFTADELHQQMTQDGAPGSVDTAPPVIGPSYGPRTGDEVPAAPIDLAAASPAAAGIEIAPPPRHIETPPPILAPDAVSADSWDVGVGGIDINVPQRHPTDPLPPPEPISAEGWDQGGGIEFDLPSTAPVAPPPIEHHEEFDPNELTIEPPRGG